MPKDRMMIVKKERCNPQGCGGYLCVRVSPSNRAGKDAIVKSDDGKVEVNEDQITQADFIAAKKCPFDALKLVNLPQELEREPLHRFDKNSFALYNLPVPKFGKVTGVIGKNGIGKSTAVKILAGLIQPNLGDYESDGASFEEVKDYFKGTEAQNYFQKLQDGEIEVSYKPQRVELIPKKYDGTCKDLLENVNEKSDEYLEELIETLELKKILDHDINNVSGGELQRMAIAATVLKDANVYIFDEPTSYLDIKQRLKLSKFIRELADADTAVMIIEHDLIILDYMTDLIHLMYGEATAYGIASQTQSTKSGINTYLSGYLASENIRFRDHEIEFEKRAPTKSTKIQTLTEWEDFTETIGNFELEANSGTIKQGEIIGILGENAIGKTSFVRILAGEIGNHELKNLDVAYKPQYLEPDDQRVSVFLKDAIQNHKNDIVEPLGINAVVNLKLSDLSGGELQRVMIAKALSEDVDLILLDEPSAYLDVEQRLKVSEIIRSVVENTDKSALVVDHDLLFLDYLSDRLTVFDGEPAVKGNVNGPYSMEEGMNKFLQDIGMTFRRDEENNRPRANKVGSVKDREQKKSGNLYYTG